MVFWPLEKAFVTALCLFLIYYDWKHREIPLLGMILLAILGFYLKGYWPSALFLIVLGLLAFVKGWAQKGDVVLLSAVGFWVSLHQLPSLCFITGCLSLVWFFLQHRSKIPFAPPLLVAFWLVVYGGW